MNKELYQKFIATNSEFLETVSKDLNRLNYHLMPPSGWLNDPNGLCTINGITHIYFQYSPHTATWGMKLWGHYSTKNFIDYTEHEPFLYPDTPSDQDGVYSGSAFVKDNQIYYFYTGNVKHKDRQYNYDYEGRQQNTMMVTSSDGENHTPKKVLLTNQEYPDFVGVHVRDPKVLEVDGVYYMLLGARDKQDCGCALLYKSTDLNNWEYDFCIKTTEKFGYMWECPDLIKIDNQYFLICSPQGVAQQGIDYANVYQVGYFKIDLDFKNKTYQLGTFYELDRGFDIYAPQTFKHENQNVLIAWMGIPDSEYHNDNTVAYNWQHALTLPRVLSYKNDRIIQKCLPNIYDIVQETQKLSNSILNVDASYILLLENIQNYQMIQIGDDVRLSYDNGIFTLMMNESGNGRQSRSVRLNTLQKLEIFKDTSSIEVFINDGEEVFTSRVYTTKNTLKLLLDADVYISKIKPFNIVKQ